MSDAENFERMLNDGQSYTFRQPPAAFRENGHIVIEGRPCKVVEISTSHDDYHFVGIDIFTAQKLEMTVPSSDNCDVPYVSRNEYLVVNIDDGFVDLINDDGSSKDGVKLPTNQGLRTELQDGFDAGKVLLVTVISAMGEEQIISVKEKP